ncbi:hypothetical protein LJ707_06015 [Mucilaginibacter sp. UR6-1]|uniref:hypothetical protein n=1 Tax=Mucilaginibacter sp. UR6-1 TaxID=1435643 RepID=UPI001E42017E|nr:hypothetical protein [Mucilaginibacter sp. UR6-1]MCC8408477.1 hypothetical protein [Mucilaginibacter sp. UR6-1]
MKKLSLLLCVSLLSVISFTAFAEVKIPVLQPPASANFATVDIGGFTYAGDNYVMYGDNVTNKIAAVYLIDIYFNLTPVFSFTNGSWYYTTYPTVYAGPVKIRKTSTSALFTFEGTTLYY